MIYYNNKNTCGGGSIPSHPQLRFNFSRVVASQFLKCPFPTLFMTPLYDKTSDGTSGLHYVSSFAEITFQTVFFAITTDDSSFFSLFLFLPLFTFQPILPVSRECPISQSKWKNKKKEKKKKKKDEGNRSFDSHFSRFLFFFSDNNFFLSRDKNIIFINI